MASKVLVESDFRFLLSTSNIGCIAASTGKLLHYIGESLSRSSVFESEKRADGEIVEGREKQVVERRFLVRSEMSLS